LSTRGFYCLAAVKVFPMVKIMTDENLLLSEIAELLLSQKLAVLASQSPEGSSYSSLIAFAATDDLQKIVFATPKATRKFINIKHNPMVSLLIDNWSNNEKDFHDAKAVTVMGKVERIDPDLFLNELESLYLNKHPYLEDFLLAPSTAFIIISVRSYLATCQTLCLSIYSREWFLKAQDVGCTC
jgi:hypothetical protein